MGPNLRRYRGRCGASRWGFPGPAPAVRAAAQSRLAATIARAIVCGSVNQISWLPGHSTRRNRPSCSDTRGCQGRLCGSDVLLAVNVRLADLQFGQRRGQHDLVGEGLVRMRVELLVGRGRERQVGVVDEGGLAPDQGNGSMTRAVVRRRDAVEEADVNRDHVVERLAGQRHEGVDVHQTADAIGHQRLGARDHHPAVAVAGQAHVAQVVLAQELRQRLRRVFQADAAAVVAGPVAGERRQCTVWPRARARRRARAPCPYARRRGPGRRCRSSMSPGWSRWAGDRSRAPRVAPAGWDRPDPATARLRAQHRGAFDLGGDRAEQRRVRGPAASRAGGQREHRVAVGQRVHRVDAARQPSWAICASLAACALVSRASVATMPIVVASGVDQLLRDSPSSSAGVRAAQHAAVGTARAGDDGGCARAGSTTSPIALTATSAANRHAVDAQRRAADAALHRPPDAEQLAHARPGAGADRSFRRRFARARG